MPLFQIVRISAQLAHPPSLRPIVLAQILAIGFLGQQHAPNRDRGHCN
jgi:hypothetical protein